ncbi:MAG: adenylate/guanylate cyclase domain-containing protein [Kofleriaceae bacterium]
MRRKLTALVGFSALAAIAILPILWWLMHHELIDQARERVPDVVNGLNEEISDDIEDLDVTGNAIAEDSDTLVALAARDQKGLGTVARPFRTAYPDLDILIFGPDRALVTQFGCEKPQAKLPDGIQFGVHVVLRHGCEDSKTAPIAVATTREIKAADGTIVGYVLVCLPLDQAYFANAQKKLGGQLALELERTGSFWTLAYATPSFPRDHLEDATKQGKLVEQEGRTWIIAAFSPPILETAKRADLELRFETANDVTDIKRIVRKHLLIAAAIIFVTTALAMWIGWRLASRMALALSRVNAAMRRLEQQEYVKVDAVKTGDELEDLALGFNQMVDGLRERDKLRVTMGKYMTEEVLQHVMAGEVELGGKTLEITILFCDLRGFTTFAEKRSAHELVAILNEYFTEMVDCVMSEGGVVDKYIGDNIMAVFGAPVSRPDDATRAVKAALKMRAALATLNARFAERGIEPLRFGIGLHTGEVVAGNIGSARRMEYTVIGDAVNVASRLESKTKELETDLLISDETNARLTAITTEPIGEVQVKGRAAPVKIFKVTGPAA